MFDNLALIIKKKTKSEKDKRFQFSSIVLKEQ